MLLRYVYFISSGNGKKWIGSQQSQNNISNEMVTMMTSPINYDVIDKTEMLIRKQNF